MGVKNILISQKQPQTASPYDTLAEKYGVKFDYLPFFKMEPLTSREFRAQKINISEYTAIVFSAKTTIDAFFQLSEELRVKIPETMKYFCTTEMVANYLQKHIVYRKRKIFFGDGTPQSVLGLIGPKHKGEKFLVTTSDSASKATIVKLFEESAFDFTPAVFVKSVPQDLSALNLHSYDAVTVLNAADVKALFANFPEFKQEDLKFITYGNSTLRALNEAGLEAAVSAPTPEIPSAAKAVETFILSQK